MEHNKILHVCRKCAPGESPDYFYLVYVEDKKAPMIKHMDMDCACNEAERLARLPCNQGKKVYILSSIRIIYVDVPPIPVTIKNL